MKEILQAASEKKASDIFIITGMPVAFKIDGQVVPQEGKKLMPEDTKELIKEIYEVNDQQNKVEDLLAKGDADFSFSLPGIGRYRVNVYRQRNSLAAVIRTVSFTLPDPKELNVPEEVMEIAETNGGLVLITGPAGSGKSTTLSCIIDRINKTRNGHIITLEDPVEFIHRHGKSIVSQREIPSDSATYSTGLRAALRESPDVILLGELRDYETINIAMTAAETGQLVLSSLHTINAAKTVDRIIDVFAPSQQQQIRMQLSMALKTVVCQQLIPSKEGKLIPAFEIMHVNPAIRNMIREGRIHQIESAIYAGKKEGMITMDSYIEKLFCEGKITEETKNQYLEK